MLGGIRKPLGIFAATAEEIRQLRRAIASSVVAGITTAALLPLVVDILQERIRQVKTQRTAGGIVLRILFYRPTLILEEPLIRMLAKD